MGIERATPIKVKDALIPLENIINYLGKRDF
jgi:hypothetical protein